MRALGEEAVGVTGPNLDETLPGQSAEQVEQSIVDPSAEIVSGFEDIMPKEYGNTIDSQELQDLVKFLLKFAGKGG
jgi:hypothetical protein